MANIQLHEGGPKHLIGYYQASKMKLVLPTFEEGLDVDPIPLTDIKYIEIADEENVKLVDPSWDLSKALSEISNSSTWGAALGILGIVGEVVAKGPKTTFVAEFKNGRKILATTYRKAFDKIKSEVG